ncbi:MAG: glycosyltransferase [Planctomycetota bacterium]
MLHRCEHVTPNSANLSNPVEPSRVSFCVSAVIPAFNCEATIGRAVESVLQQSHAVKEVIVIDDGSTDQTAMLASRYGDRVRCVSQANGGPSSARNAGIDLARGEWIAFLDADDIWYPSKLDRQRELLGHFDDLDVLFSDWLIRDLGQQAQGSGFTVPECQSTLGSLHVARADASFVRIQDDMFPVLLEEYVLHTNAAVVRRKALKDFRFEPAYRWGEDWLLFLDLASRGARFGYVDEPLTEYRARADSICNRATLQTVTHRYEISKLPLKRYGILPSDLKKKLYPRISIAARVLGIRLWDEARQFGHARAIWREAARLKPGFPDLKLLIQSFLPRPLLNWLRDLRRDDGSVESVT